MPEPQAQKRPEWSCLGVGCCKGCLWWKLQRERTGGPDARILPRVCHTTKAKGLKTLHQSESTQSPSETPEGPLPHTLPPLGGGGKKEGEGEARRPSTGSTSTRSRLFHGYFRGGVCSHTPGFRMGAGSVAA